MVETVVGVGVGGERIEDGVEILLISTVDCVVAGVGALVSHPHIVYDVVYNTLSYCDSNKKYNTDKNKYKPFKFYCHIICGMSMVISLCISSKRRLGENDSCIVEKLNITLFKNQKLGPREFIFLFFNVRLNFNKICSPCPKLNVSNKIDTDIKK